MKSVIVKPDNIELPAGAVVKLPGTWQDYQTLLQQLGDRTSSQIKYRNRELLLMVPLPEHILLNVFRMLISLVRKR